MSQKKPSGPAVFVEEVPVAGECGGNERHHAAVRARPEYMTARTKRICALIEEKWTIRWSRVCARKTAGAARETTGNVPEAPSGRFSCIEAGRAMHRQRVRGETAVCSSGTRGCGGKRERQACADWPKSFGRAQVEQTKTAAGSDKGRESEKVGERARRRIERVLDRAATGLEQA